MKMSDAELINILFFSLISLISIFLSLPVRRRVFACTIGAFGIAVCLFLAAPLALFSTQTSLVLRHWMPVGLILVAYHQSGQLFSKPWPRFQALLMEWDRRLLGRFYRGPEVIQVPSFWRIYLEIFYLFCYPLIPAALGILVLLNFQDRVEEFWLIVLSSTYACYALVPFLPAFPPRLLHTDQKTESSPGKARAINEWLLRYGSIQANTFPSAHVASCTAASLVLFRYNAWFGAAFLWFSLSIAAAVVIRRYHYLADSITGLALPVVLFFLMT
jgi:hypothetical protein